MVEPVYLPEVRSFMELFPTFAWDKSQAPFARQWRVTRQVHGRSYFENIPIVPDCAIINSDGNQTMCYVDCSDRVFATIERRMLTWKNDSVVFRVEIGHDGTALVSARNRRSE